MKPTDREYALELDRNDPLASFRSEFVITDENLCYLDGNSLGRLPKATIERVNHFLLNEWGSELVDGWAHWIDEAQTAGDLLGRAVLGAAAGQTLVCDTTSVNFINFALRPSKRDRAARPSSSMRQTFQQIATFSMALPKVTV